MYGTISREARFVSVLASIVALFVLVLPAIALAADAPPPQRTLALPTDQIWAAVAGGLAPLVAYMLNYVGPYVDERLKGVVQALAAAIAGGIAQAITAGDVGFNAITLQFVVTAMLTAVVGHKAYAASGINVAFGGGRNRQTT